jgi:hypothetical protein
MYIPACSSAFRYMSVMEQSKYFKAKLRARILNFTILFMREARRQCPLWRDEQIRKF